MLDLTTVAFQKAQLVMEQHRLISKYLVDPWHLTIFDNSKDDGVAEELRLWASYRLMTVSYRRVEDETHEHIVALNQARDYLIHRGHSHIGFLDHDVFPTKPTSILEKIGDVGFYGIGQRHAPTQGLYLWPGFMFLSRKWLDTKQPRELNFDGYRGPIKADDGDTGSANIPLFEDEDWSKLFCGEHGYRAIREPDSVGLQSWGIEVIGGEWIHLTNASNWMNVPRWEEREALTMEILANL